MSLHYLVKLEMLIEDVLPLSVNSKVKKYTYIAHNTITNCL